jgi:hypothetical protein
MRNFSYTVGFLSLIIGGIIISACKKDKTTEGELNVECETVISYDSDIRQTIQQSCNTTGCHNAASSSAGYSFETHEQVSSNAEIILKVIRHEPGVVAMPIGDKLSDEYIENFFCWIEQGKPNN